MSARQTYVLRCDGAECDEECYGPSLARRVAEVRKEAWQVASWATCLIPGEGSRMARYEDYCATCARDLKLEPGQHDGLPPEAAH